MKAEELAVIKERAENATNGPWVADGSYGGVHTQNPDYQDVSRSWSGSHNGICNIWDGEYIENSNRQGDAEFIAHARQDVPKLVAEVERLQAQEHFAEYAIRQNKALWEALSKACESLGADTLDYYEEEGGV